MDDAAGAVGGWVDEVWVVGRAVHVRVVSGGGTEGTCWRAGGHWGLGNEFGMARGLTLGLGL